MASESIAGDSGDASDVSIAGDEQSSRPSRSGCRGRGAQAAAKRVRVFLVVADSKNAMGKAVMPQDFPAYCRQAHTPPKVCELLLLGMVLGPCWSFARGTDLAPSLDVTSPGGFMRSLAMRRSRACYVYGFAEVLIIEAAPLLDPVSLDEGDNTMTVVRNCAELPVKRYMVGAAEGMTCSFKHVLEYWTQAHDSIKGIVMRAMSPTFAGMVVGGLWPLLHTVPLTHKTCKKRFLVENDPPPGNDCEFSFRKVVALSSARRRQGLSR